MYIHTYTSCPTARAHNILNYVLFFPRSRYHTPARESFCTILEIDIYFHMISVLLYTLVRIIFIKIVLASLLFSD